MSVEDNVALLRKIYAAYGRKDAAPLFDSLGEAVQFRIVAHPDHFPFAGIHHGRAAVQEAIGLVARDYDWLEYAAHDFIAEGDRVVALTGGVVKYRGTGQQINLELVDVVRVVDGKIIEFTEFCDTASVLAAHGPARVKSRAKASGKAGGRAKLPKKAAKKAKPKGRKLAAKKSGAMASRARKSKALRPKVKKKSARRR